MWLSHSICTNMYICPKQKTGQVKKSIQNIPKSKKCLPLKFAAMVHFNLSDLLIFCFHSAHCSALLNLLRAKKSKEWIAS